ncbi:BREX system Lon protease-like protein BrxL [[Collinsella] massiliensis]|uniref:TIGR02688 family protein n=1 Tax=[Collinsella] massiliensis TaxID=1232426 RepID=A0A1Y3XHI6_9ACTN|nr:BREX system Lon protease-like protein BrxL [[Collinsella] massiliensis]OUN85022.1 TIGR02688 family protein [[Collinsella] massiliensis]
MEQEHITAPVAEAPAYEKDALDEKIVRNFPGKIVRKDLTALMKRGAGIPTFVLEYLLGMYCATDDPEALAAGLDRIRKILADNYVRTEESEVIKSRIRELGQYTIIDKVSASLDERRDLYVAQLANLAIEPFVMPDEYVRKYTKMLTGGIWCIARIQYLRPEDAVEDPLADVFGEDPAAATKLKPQAGKKGPENSPFHILDLTPIQMPNLDVDELISHRADFTTDEWIALILRSAGYEPSVLSPRERLHFLTRMVPLIELNYNLCELGPRGTGKSHIYTEVSPYSYLLSGGQATTAMLFANNTARTGGIGLVGHWDCIAFDEVAGMHYKDENAIQIMKGYMANGTFGRGREQFNAEASMVFEGNINDSVANILKTTHLFEPFPPEFNNDSAFFDRIHCYLPGWEVPKMRSDLLTGRYSLITDCLSEFCHEMRRRDFTHYIDQYFRLNSDFNRRDEIGVRKTFSGLAKLVFPDGRMGKEDVRMLLEYAIEGRRRVKEQLKIMAGIEFIDVQLGYVDVENPSESVVVRVPEQASDTLIPEGGLMPGHVFAIGTSVGDETAVYKLENKAVTGEMRFSVEGVGHNKPVSDSLNAAFEQFKQNAPRLASGMNIASKNYLLYYNDIQNKGLSAELSLAEFIGLCSAAANHPVMPGLVIPGILRISGTLEPISNLEDVMRVAKNAGAKRVLLPMSSIADLQGISPELIGSVSPEFYNTGDIVSAAQKALGI